MPGYYPDKSPQADDGRTFEALVEYLHLRFLHEDIEIFHDRESQFNIGESRAGVECKHLKKSVNRLHIELFEKTRVSKKWQLSGINRNDNTTRYACGNEQDVFVFRRDDLRRWLCKHKPPEVWHGLGGLGRPGDVSLRATIHSYVLTKDDAEKFYLYRFRRDKAGEWYFIDKRARAYPRQFLHYCHCGEWGSFGFGVSVRARYDGQWYCSDHKLGAISKSAPNLEWAPNPKTRLIRKTLENRS